MASSYRMDSGAFSFYSYVARRLGTAPLVFLLISWFGLAQRSAAAELNRVTLDSWNGYILAVEADMNSRASEPRKFLWMDEDSQRVRRVRNGEMVVGPAHGHGMQNVPDGLIHDWVGTTFIPAASIDRVREVLRDYDNYKHIYDPQVIDSRTLERTDAADQFSMKWVDKILMVSSGIDTECRVQNVSLGKRRYYRSAYTTRVQEIQNYGQPNQHALPPDQGDGYLWRLYSVARLEERDGGVYLEIEAIALSRDIPSSLRFFVTPLVKRLSRNSLYVSLRKTQDAVQSIDGSTPSVASAEANSRLNAGTAFHKSRSSLR